MCVPWLPGIYNSLYLTAKGRLRMSLCSGVMSSIKAALAQHKHSSPAEAHAQCSDASCNIRRTALVPSILGKSHIISLVPLAFTGHGKGQSGTACHTPRGVPINFRVGQWPLCGCTQVPVIYTDIQSSEILQCLCWYVWSHLPVSGQSIAGLVSSPKGGGVLLECNFPFPLFQVDCL